MKKKISVVLSICLALVFFVACTNRYDEKNASFYTLDLVFNAETNVITGRQTVDFYNSFDVELADIHFHLFANAHREGAQYSPFTANEINDAFPNGRSFGGIEITSLRVDGADSPIVIGGRDEDRLIVKLPRALMPTQRVMVEMEYTLTIPNVRHRFGHYNGIVNLGNFFPIAAVFENGQWSPHVYYSIGDPFFTKAKNFKVSITAPNNLMAAMSGRVTRAPFTNGNTQTTHTSSGTLMRDFAIVLGEFQVVTGEVDGVEVRYYFTQETSMSSADALAVSMDSVRVFNELFGNYPWETLSVVKTHFLHGGMEYPGLVYISDTLSGNYFRDVIVHEIAHQWWYAIVGNNQVDHAWLDESLAEYSVALFYERMPQFGVSYSDRIAESLRTFALFEDIFGKNFDGSMNRSLSEFNSPYEYVVVAYQKGAVMLSSLRQIIGDDAFFSALRKYFQNHKFGIARPENLVAAFEVASNKNLQPFFNTWFSGEVQTFGRV
ncbi:MAG: M1 family metallopeptidase [Firmicutes bacterium]|nr:M1 family metallopeptidase [Bacillota bacterium]MCL2256340.1 M1 family metallopeptidase [Bacillota bacterium]